MSKKLITSRGMKRSGQDVRSFFPKVLRLDDSADNSSTIASDCEIVTYSETEDVPPGPLLEAKSAKSASKSKSFEYANR